MNYSEAVQYLQSFLNYEVDTRYTYSRDLNLERTRALLRRFGRPDKKYRSVLVAGTKGKGSTAVLLESLLREAGYRVGLFTSPHLQDFRERVRISGEPIPERDFADTLSEIRSSLEKSPLAPSLRKPTFFEVLTVLTMIYFARERIQLGIFEVGMGGRLDATNVLRPQVCLLTPISYDHQDKLGRTLTAIAREKIAVVKHHGRFVSAKQAPSVRCVFDQWVKRKRARAYFLGEDFSCTVRHVDCEGTRFDFIGEKVTYRDLFTRLPGDFQAENACAALQGLFLLERHFRVGEEQIRKALREVIWPGRFEILEKEGFTYVLDGAHNGASVKVLFENLRRIFPERRVSLVLGISRDKDWRRMLQAMAPHAPEITATEAQNPRAMEASELLGRCKGFLYRDGIEGGKPLTKALEKARSKARDRLVVVTGSLYLVAEARRILCPD